jgi:adenosylcobinamide kinase/adenosylcobinamide-phosphate guanylyltransferase
VLVDDVGNWLTSALDAAGAWEVPGGSPEVGWGVVPATRAGRVFADAQGGLNHRLAAACDAVTLVVAGLPVRLK